MIDADLIRRQYAALEAELERRRANRPDPAMLAAWAERPWVDDGIYPSETVAYSCSLSASAIERLFDERQRLYHQVDEDVVRWNAYVNRDPTLRLDGTAKEHRKIRRYGREAVRRQTAAYQRERYRRRKAHDPTFPIYLRELERRKRARTDPAVLSAREERRRERARERYATDPEYRAARQAQSRAQYLRRVATEEGRLRERERWRANYVKRRGAD